MCMLKIITSNSSEMSRNIVKENAYNQLFYFLSSIYFPGNEEHTKKIYYLGGFPKFFLLLKERLHPLGQCKG